jgi:hypothetical protein
MPISPWHVQVKPFELKVMLDYQEFQATLTGLDEAQLHELRASALCALPPDAPCSWAMRVAAGILLIAIDLKLYQLSQGEKYANREWP